MQALNSWRRGLAALIARIELTAAQQLQFNHYCTELYEDFRSAEDVADYVVRLRCFGNAAVVNLSVPLLKVVKHGITISNNSALRTIDLLSMRREVNEKGP